ncbi:MAG: 5-oxoprolinase subunit B family protein [Actinomycetota bacterium]
MRVRAYGREATIVDGLAEGIAGSLRTHVLDACTAARLQCDDVVPAAESFVVTHTARDAELMLGLLAQLIGGWLAEPSVATGAEASNDVPVEIAVRYDGADLADIATACSLSIDEVISLHSGADYRVAFCGFAPGFAYLIGLPKTLHTARRESPRAQVPAGSVAIAAGYSAVYPRESPGGWHLLGTTTATMWDSTRDSPALLQPGQRVRFVRVV